MKKFYITLCAGLLLFSHIANAQNTPVQVVGDSTKPKPVQRFLGFEVSDVSVGLADNSDLVFEDRHSALTVLGGYKVNNRIGITGFYQFSSEEEKKVGSLTTSGRFTAFGFDANLYVPVNEKFNLIGMFGAGCYDFEVSSNSALLDGSEKHYGVRVGGGGELMLSDKLALTGMARFVVLDYDDTVDYVENIAEIGVGLRLYF